MTPLPTGTLGQDLLWIGWTYDFHITIKFPIKWLAGSKISPPWLHSCYNINEADECYVHTNVEERQWMFTKYIPVHKRFWITLLQFCHTKYSWIAVINSHILFMICFTGTNYSSNSQDTLRIQIYQTIPTDSKT